MRVPLILECEWGTDLSNIDEDFGKLLVGRADHRVMIFPQKTQDEVIRVMDYLEDHIKRFEQGSAGDRYLLAGLDWTTTGSFSDRLVVR